MFEKNVLARGLYNYGFDVYAFYVIKNAAIIRLQRFGWCAIRDSNPGHLD